MKVFMPLLKAMVEKKHCQSVIEFGVRTGNSTIALLAGKPKMMISVDIAPFAEVDEYVAAAVEAGVEYTFVQENDLRMRIPMTDLLFIDTDHVYPQLHNELTFHACKVRKYIVFHDTHMPPWCVYGDSSALMWKAIGELMATGEWYLHRDDVRSFGLTILGRTGRYAENWSNTECGWTDEEIAFYTIPEDVGETPGTEIPPKES